MAYRPLCAAKAPALVLLEDAAGVPSVHLSQNYRADAAKLSKAGAILLSVPLPALISQTVLLEAMGGLARMAEAKAWSKADAATDVIRDWKTSFRLMEALFAAADPESALSGSEPGLEWALVNDLAAVWGAASPAIVNQRVTDFVASRMNGATPAPCRASDYVELAGNRLAKVWKRAGREAFAVALPAVVHTIDRELSANRTEALAERTFGALTIAVAESGEAAK